MASRELKARGRRGIIALRPRCDLGTGRDGRLPGRRPSNAIPKGRRLWVDRGNRVPGLLNMDGPPSMTNRARMYLRYRDLDIPTSWEGATRERGRPARNLIRASSLRSRGIPSNSAPNRPLQGSLLWRQVLCGRDARAPGWAFSHSLLLLKRACRVAGPQPCRADHAREPLANLAVGQVVLPAIVMFCLFQ